MKNGMPEHYWRIHKRVTLRVWQDTPAKVRDIIASDSAHETQESQWFAKKVDEDARRLFEDPGYYDNDLFTFKVAKRVAKKG